MFGIGLVMRRRSGAGEMIDARRLEARRERIDDVVLDQLEPRLPLQMGEVAARASDEIVEAQNPRAFGDQPVAQVASR